MNKNLLITGASSGIGEAIARLAAKQGYNLCINYCNSAKRAEQLAEELRQHKINIITVQADISKEPQVVSLFKQVEAELGMLSALVNNAGVITPISTLNDISAQRIANVFAINVMGTMLCSREAGKHMNTDRGGNGGAIVNISSVAASLGSPNEFVDYAATKGAIDSFTKGHAKEVANSGIRVNAVRPGLIATQMHQHAGDVDRLERLKPSIPMQREGYANEVAEAVMWLLSDSASYVTGSILDVSGGR